MASDTNNVAWPTPPTMPGAGGTRQQKRRLVFGVASVVVLLVLGGGGYFAYSKGYFSKSKVDSNKSTGENPANSVSNSGIQSNRLNTQSNFENQFGQIQELRDALFAYFSFHQDYPDSLGQLQTGMQSLQSDCEQAAKNSNSTTFQKFKDVVVGGLATDGTYCDAFAPKTYSRGDWKYGIDSWDKLQTQDIYANSIYSYSRDNEDYRLEFIIKHYPEIDEISKRIFVDGRNTATNEEVSLEAIQQQAADFFQNTNYSVDTDGDGLSDRNENDIYKTDPERSDTDGDGINDNIEIQSCATSPVLADSDSDGYGDREEILGGYNPNGAGTMEASSACKAAVS